MKAVLALLWSVVPLLAAGEAAVPKVFGGGTVAEILWVRLDKGDLVQTGPEGVARITFGDRTSYTVKPETLITVE